MKKIGIIFALIIFVVALSGCGGNTKCIAEGCNEEAYKDGLCKDHYVKLNKTNDAETTTNVTEEEKEESKEATKDKSEGKESEGLDWYIDVWSGSDRWAYEINKKDNDSVSITYHGSSSAAAGMDGVGTGRLENGCLVCEMEYSEYIFDDKGNSATRKICECTDTAMPVSFVSDSYVLNSKDSILTRSRSFKGYPAPEEVKNCVPKDDYLIWEDRICYDDNNDVFWYSSDIYLSDVDVMGLDKEQLRIARNEIYARHGRKFSSADLQEHFNNCSWYTGTIESDKFNENVLSEIEKANIKFIENAENGAVSNSAITDSSLTNECTLRGLVKDDILDWYLSQNYYNYQSEHDVYSDAYELGNWVGNLIGNANATMLNLSRNIGNNHEWLFGTDIGNNITNNFRYYYAYYFALKDYYNSNGTQSKDVYNYLVKECASWGYSNPDQVIKELFNDIQPIITESNNIIRSFMN